MTFYRTYVPLSLADPTQKQVAMPLSAPSSLPVVARIIATNKDVRGWVVTDQKADSVTGSITVTLEPPRG